MAEDSKLEFWKEKLAGTKTEQNLHTALGAESQAYLRYKWFENQAKKDGNCTAVCPDGGERKGARRDLVPAPGRLEHDRAEPERCGGRGAF